MNVEDFIIYEDAAFIAFNKPAPLPSQPDPTGDKSLWEYADEYLGQKSYLLHRLDRPTSGVILFAKTEQAAALVSQQFQNRETQKSYLAVVENAPLSMEGDLVHFLIENAEKNKVFVDKNTKSGAKRAELHYILRGSSDRYHLLEIELKTGRHHQIRAQLAAIGCPIKGDVKYGARRANHDRSIHLHAWKLTFWQPFLKKKVSLIAELPNETLWQFFNTIVKNADSIRK